MFNPRRYYRKTDVDRNPEGKIHNVSYRVTGHRNLREMEKSQKDEERGGGGREKKGAEKKNERGRAAEGGEIKG